LESFGSILAIVKPQLPLIAEKVSSKDVIRKIDEVIIWISAIIGCISCWVS
jgi:hypothetical protein